MFAVIKTGGKQYKVAKNDIIRIEKLDGKAGDSIKFDEVLMVGDKIGTPMVAGASVSGVIKAMDRNDKVIIFKKKRRQNYRRKRGHKQHVTIVQITDIAG